MDSPWLEMSAGNLQNQAEVCTRLEMMLHVQRKQAIREAFIKKTIFFLTNVNKGTRQKNCVENSTLGSDPLPFNINIEYFI